MAKDNDKDKQTELESSIGLGEELRKAREQKKLTIEKVVKQLHLKKDHIIAIEHDDYSNILSLSYVRGYIRNYAKFLGLNVDEILAKFDALGLTEEKPSPLNNEFLAYANIEKKHKRDHKFRWIGLIIFVLIVIIVAIIWQSSRDENNLIPPTDTTNSTQQIIPPVSS